MRKEIVMLSKVIGAACVVIALTIGADCAHAKAPPCSKNEIAIKDERPGKQKICLKKSEVAKAKKSCGHKKWIGCICQDGNSVGACGN